MNLFQRLLKFMSALTFAAVAASAQAEYTDGKVNIIFTDANYSEKSCVLSFDARNNTKYHVNKISFVVGTWQHGDFRISELPANAYADKNQVEVNLSENESCADQVAFIIHNIGKASSLVCSMPNITEGDCQQMVAISTSLDNNLVRKIQAAEDAEKAKAEVAKAALVAACSKLRPAVDEMERCTARCNGDAYCDSKCGYLNTSSYREWYEKCQSQGIEAPSSTQSRTAGEAEKDTRCDEVREKYAKFMNCWHDCDPHFGDINYMKQNIPSASCHKKCDPLRSSSPSRYGCSDN